MQSNPSVPHTFTIHHCPLCFPIVVLVEGFSQVLCHELLAESGRLVHNHPHFSPKLLQIDASISIRRSQATLLRQSCGACSKPLGQGHLPGAQLSKPPSMALVAALR